jgi:SAM-dependent methyltransferase
MEAGRSFDSVAALYDAQRSGYPQKLFEDLSAIAILRRGDRVLEVGCGSGQATTGLVAQGFDIIAIDPGPSLVDLARKKFANLPRIQFTVASFEEWILGDQKFRLVAAAQSWTGSVLRLDLPRLRERSRPPVISRFSATHQPGRLSSLSAWSQSIDALRQKYAVRSLRAGICRPDPFRNNSSRVDTLNLQRAAATHGVADILRADLPLISALDLITPVCRGSDATTF